MTTTEFYKEIDAVVAMEFTNPTSIKPCCTKGCNTCCSEALMASRQEARHILEHYPSDKLDALKQRVKDWFEKFKLFQFAPTQDGLIDGYSYLEADIKCPLLEGKLCGVYEHRPFGCRVYFAQGDPEHCKMPHRKNQLIAAYDFGHPAWSRLWLKTALTSGELYMDHLGVHLYNLLFNESVETSVSIKYIPQ